MSKCKFKQQRNISFWKTDIDEIVEADKKLLIYKLNGVMFNDPYYFESIHVQQNLSKSLEKNHIFSYVVINVFNFVMITINRTLRQLLTAS